MKILYVPAVILSFYPNQRGIVSKMIIKWKAEIGVLLFSFTLFFVSMLITPSLYGEESDVLAFVTRFYQQCLNRSPDEAGLDNWVASLNSGEKAGADLAESFIFSEEFENRNTSDEEYIDILYRAFFNREADQAGYNNWMSLLTSGASRASVLDGFTSAQEFIALCDAYGIPATSEIDEMPVSAFVTRFYQQCLNRDPDVEGLNNWVESLNSGEKAGAELAKAFIFSEEFENRNISNDEYITTLYSAFFNREPDQEGYDSWMVLLDAGTDRATVLDGFTSAQEFISLCDMYGITPYIQDTSSFIWSGEWSGSYAGADSGTLAFTVGTTGNVYGKAYSNYVQGYLNISGFVYEDGFLIADAAGNEFTGQMDRSGSVSGQWSSTYHSGTFTAIQTSVSESDPDAGEAQGNVDMVLFQSSNIGRLHYLSNEEFTGFATAVVGGPELENFEFSAKVMSADDDHIGLLFKYQDFDNYYAFIMDDPTNNEATGTCLIKVIDGKVSFLTSMGRYESYEKNRWYNIKIIVNGDHIQVYRDSQILFDINSSDTESGKIGLACDYNAGSYFDDIIVSQDNIEIFNDNFDDGSMENWQIIEDSSADDAPSNWFVRSKN